MKYSPASTVTATAISLCLGASGYAHAATMVDIELAFIVDGSDSNVTFDDQRQAYVNIFRNDFYNNIVAPLNGIEPKPGQTGTGRIAVAMFQFGGFIGSPANDYLGNPDLGTAVDWLVIESQADADAFADEIDLMTQKGGNRSPIGAGIAQATFGTPGMGIDGIVTNDIDSIQSVFDLASDGQENTAGTPSSIDILAFEAAFDAYEAGVDIMNVIAFPDPPSSNNEDILQEIIDQFGTNTNLNGTLGQLVLPNNSFPYEQFLNNKILNETEPPSNVQDVPEPSLVVGLLSLGLLGMVRRR